MEFVTNPSYRKSTQHRCLNTLFQQPSALWYIPVNHGYNHWLYLTINTFRKHIGQHDSFPGHINHDYATQVCHMLTDANHETWTSEHVSTLRQQNSYNYGIYVLVNIHRQVSGNIRGPTGTPSCAQLHIALNTGTLPATLYHHTPTHQPVAPMDPIEARVCPTPPDPFPPSISSPQKSNIPPDLVKSKQPHLTQSETVTIISHLNPPPDNPENRGTQAHTHDTPSEPALHTPTAKSTTTQKQHRECNQRPYGAIMGPKSANILRIYSQNVNGIPVDNIKDAMTKNLDVMIDWQVDIMG